MAMVLFLSICVVVILTMSLNSDVVAIKLEDSTRHDHQVDGVLEDVVNEVRNDSGACTTGITVGQFAVDCTSAVISADPPARRADLTVTENGDSSVVGKARIKVVDDPSEGYTLEVCDWLLSRNVTETLRGCA